jgi:arylsulfatase A-like enzyme
MKHTKTVNKTTLHDKRSQTSPAARSFSGKTTLVCRWFATAVLAPVAAAFLAAPVRSADPDRPPNIIFILADDLGYGDLGCYGQQKIQTPNLDRLAAEGMRFTQFYAGSTVCAPSRCALMTGLHTGHGYIRGNGRENLRPEDVTVARVLKQRGYATGLVGKWGLGHEGSTGVPTEQGFDDFFGYLDQVHAHNYYPSFLLRNGERVALPNVVANEGPFGQGVATKKVQYSHDLMSDEALGFIDRHQDKPFFLYLAWTVPHANNEAGRQGMEVPDYGPYANRDWPEPQKGHAAMITRMDQDVGKLLARLKRHGIDERTIVFFSSDNGPHREAGIDPDFADSNGPLRGIKRSLHDGGIRVPMLVRWPGKIAAGAVSDFVGAFWDVLPTLAELAGAGDHVPAGLDGLSFVPTLVGRGHEQQQHDHLFWFFYEQGGARAMRRGAWKAVQQPLDSPVRLYDLAEDVGEQNDVAASQPEIVADLQRRMEETYVPSARWRFPATADAGSKK